MALPFDLPDFGTPAHIEPTNIDAMGVVYAAYQFEQLRLFDVVDRLVEQFISGHLPIGQGSGTALIAYAQARADRLTPATRRQIYSRTLGLPSGSTEGALPNREFSDLWTRFVAAVSSFVAELRGSTTHVSQAEVIEAGHHLASNLSLHGYGMGLYAARELHRQLAEAVAIVSAPEILGAFGARDMWQLIDQVATLELGGARQSARHRTLASTGTVIIRWLARRSSALTSDAVQVLDPNALLAHATSPVPPRLSPTPTDLDLVDACEYWLVAAGTTDDAEYR